MYDVCGNGRKQMMVMFFRSSVGRLHTARHVGTKKNKKNPEVCTVPTCIESLKNIDQLIGLY